MDDQMSMRFGVRLVFVLLCCGFVEAFFLERGHRGIVPCPLVKSGQIPPGDVDAMYWYYGSISRTSLLISYFLGRVAPQNGIPEGVYDIDNEFNLVIENVTASNEGTYYFQLKPQWNVMRRGQVEVYDKVSPRRPYPTVIGCNQDHDGDTCEVRVRYDCMEHDLTCVMEQVKPAVELRWFLGGLTEFKASTTVTPLVLPADSGSLLRNNTFSTSASIQVPTEYHDAEYVCEAVGVAVEGSTRTKVRLTETQPTTATYDEVQFFNNPAITDGTVFLERGHRGIVPCPPVKSGQIPPGDIEAMYWYYGSISRTSMLISYILGSVASPSNGIPEGVYHIDDEFSLIIENVNASNEGTYYFQLKPRLKVLQEGQVEVDEKVSPSRPYPTVVGCNQDHDADKCVVRLYDSTVHTLTCIMEHVKPAVKLKWFRLFLGGVTELNASTTVSHVVLPACRPTNLSLRNNTYSTSASVQVTVVDDEEVYVCEAVGVVGKGTRMIVRVTNTHPTTIHEVWSSNNTGTTLTTTDVVSPTAYNPVGFLVTLLVVMSLILVIFTVMCIYIIVFNTEASK